MRRPLMRRLACAVVDVAPELVAGVKTAAVLTGLGLRVVCRQATLQPVLAKPA